MLAHKIETMLNEDGILTLQALPFNKGDRVEIIILKHEQESRRGHKRTIGEYSGKIKISDDFCGSMATNLDLVATSRKNLDCTPQTPLQPGYADLVDESSSIAYILSICSTSVSL